MTINTRAQINGDQLLFNCIFNKMCLVTKMRYLFVQRLVSVYYTWYVAIGSQFKGCIQQLVEGNITWRKKQMMMVMTE